MIDTGDDPMTLDEAKVLLSKNKIPFELQEFNHEAEYWHHATLFPYTKNARPCKVVAMVIKSKNGKKDIELQFNAAGDAFRFEELRFGDFCYELFDCNEVTLADDLIRNISEIQKGHLIVIVLNEIRKKRWLADACFDRSNDDDTFGAPGFQKALQQIKKPKGLFSKLLGAQKQYEIYDWNTYQRIVK
ncbi:MAG: hypothetical protein PUC59_03545 [Firmicutes bacterium]|nr:hypothetical protein [Bacillota bacterium]